MRTLVEVEGLVQRMGRREVLRDVTFALPSDVVTVLLGPNGAGKSTLMRVLLGLLAPDRGVVRVLGLEPLRAGQRVRRAVGYVPDHPDVPPWITPRELFRFLATDYPRWDAERALALAREYDVPLDVRFAGLSRGQAARALLVAALAPAPELLVLDECFAGLDPIARRDLLAHFVGELAERGTAALVATHDLDVAARIAERVLVLHEGRIAAQGTLEEVLGVGADAGGLPRKLLRLLEAPETEAALS